MKKNSLQSTQLVFKALLVAQALFLGAAIYLKSQGMMPDTGAEIERILQVAALVVSAAFVFLGRKLFMKKIQVIRNSSARLIDKMGQYRAAALIQWAMTEAACLFSIVGFLLTGNYAFVGLAAVLLFIFTGYYPMKTRVVQQLQLNDAEAAEL